MRVRDRDEFEAVFGNERAAEIPALLAERYGRRSDCFVCYRVRGAPVVCGGFLELRPRTVSLLMFATDELPTIGLPFTRWVRQRMSNMERAGVHRFECMTLAGYFSMHRWLGLLGLEREGEHHGWGANGERFLSYARTKV